MRPSGRPFALTLLLLAALPGCEAPHFPGEHRTPGTDPAPQIAPLHEVLAVGGTASIDPEDPAALQARADQLKARTGALALETTDDAERARLLQAASGG